MPYEFNPFTEEFDFYLYDPTEYKAKTLPTFTAYSTMTNLSSPRAIHMAAASTADGIIFAQGGYPHYGALEIYDISAGTWSTPTTTGCTPMNKAVCVYDEDNDCFHFVAGADESGDYLNKWQIYTYDTSGGSWEVKTATVTERKSPFGCIHQGKIYVCGGADSSGVLSSGEVIAISSSATGGSMASMPTSRSTGACGIVCGYFYCYGGITTTSTWNNATNKVERYDFASDTWSDVTPSTGDPPYALNRLAYAVLGDGKLHTWCGADASNHSHNYHQIFDGSSWMTGVAAPANSAGTGAAAYEDNAYLFGYDFARIMQGNVSCYDIVEQGECS